MLNAMLMIQMIFDRSVVAVTAWMIETNIMTVQAKNKKINSLYDIGGVLSERVYVEDVGCK